jgi:hypothetical protein
VVSAFEAPSELTPGFLSSRKIDYVIQIKAANATEDSSTAGLPASLAGNSAGSSAGASVAGTEVFDSIQGEKVWRVWKVKQ